MVADIAKGQADLFLAVRISPGSVKKCDAVFISFFQQGGAVL